MTAALEESALEEFLGRHPPRSYLLKPGIDRYRESELAPVGDDDGMMRLNEIPKAPPLGEPRRSHQESGRNCHLWVIDERGRVGISESPIPRLGSGKLHHTNLTGGGKASLGGEIWFASPEQIYLSGSSGRYPPVGPNHLEEAEQLFRDVGFEVIALGWDEEVNQPQRVWKQDAAGK